MGDLNWKADDHKWGKGKVHGLGDLPEKTNCNKSLQEIGGDYSEATINCGACIAKPINEEKREVQRQGWEAKNQEREAKRAQESAEGGQGLMPTRSPMDGRRRPRRS